MVEHAPTAANASYSFVPIQTVQESASRIAGIALFWASAVQ